MPDHDTRRLGLVVAPKGGREVASSRYRVHDLLPLLRERAWDVRVLTPSTERHRRIRNALTDSAACLRRPDVVLVQRPGRRREERAWLALAARRGVPIVVDIDDPVAKEGTFAWALRRASFATAGSRAAAEDLRGYVPHVTLLPTSLDARVYRLPGRRQPGLIGWIGDGPAYAESLVRLLDTLTRAGDSSPVRIVGTRGDQALSAALRAAAGPRELELVPTVRWEDEATVAREVARYDLGLVPFRDARGAAFKATQYLAAGVIPIVEAGGEAELNVRAALGSHAAIVAPGDAPSLAAALDRLREPPYRSRLRAACYESALRLFDRAVTAEHLSTVLRRAAAAAK